MRFSKFIFLLAFLTSTSVAFSQLSENAIGLRLGGSDGIGPEISYQRLLGESNRLELDLGFNSKNTYDAFKLTGIYQWVRPLSALGDGFHWYFGVGAGIGFFDYDPALPAFADGDNEEIFVSADGMVGVEYSFLQQDLPLMIALDLNPEVELINEFNDDFDLELALSIRYQF